MLLKPFFSTITGAEIEQISDMLENYGGNMSAEELAEYKELFDELKEMYENISKIREVVELVEANYPNIPADED